MENEFLPLGDPSSGYSLFLVSLPLGVSFICDQFFYSVILCKPFLSSESDEERVLPIISWDMLCPVCCVYGDASESGESWTWPVSDSGSFCPSLPLPRGRCHPGSWWSAGEHWVFLVMLNWLLSLKKSSIRETLNLKTDIDCSNDINFDIFYFLIFFYYFFSFT